MGRLALILLLLAAAASSARAGFILDAHERHNGRASGARSTDGLSRVNLVLMETDNAMLGHGAVTPAIGPVDAMWGLELENLSTPIGVLTNGLDHTLYTFDRLYGQPVLQVLEFDDSQPGAINMGTPGRNAGRGLLPGGPLGAADEGGGSPGQGTPSVETFVAVPGAGAGTGTGLNPSPTPTVPEPATAATLAALGVLLAVGVPRPRWGRPKKEKKAG